MILLLGGTSETRPVAHALAEYGVRVIASTATDNELDVGDHPNITRRTGRLSADEMAALIRETRLRLVLDASHPYAAALHTTAQQAASRCGVAYIRYERPGVSPEGGHVLFADSHEEAARIAFALGKPVLLTTGSRNLEPYVAQARKMGIAIVARVLPHAESEKACHASGLVPEEVIAARGPFTTQQNVETIKHYGIGVLVTKESGAAGGMAEKYGAAEMTGCAVVVVGRPQTTEGAYRTIDAALEAVRRILGK